MKTIVLILSLCMVYAATSAQTPYEVREFSGRVLSIEPGFTLAYEVLKLQTEKAIEPFLFYPDYGDIILKNVKEGQMISVRVKVDVKKRETFERLKEEQKRDMVFLQSDRIAEIKATNEWIVLPEIGVLGTQRPPEKFMVFLEQRVSMILTIDEDKRGILTDGGNAGYVAWASKNFNPLKEVKVGDVISFAGWRSLPRPGFRFPFSDNKEIYNYYGLKKQTGSLKSYLFKQNYVCIGAKFITERGDFSLSFPSDFAQRITDFLIPEKKVTLYFHDYKIENQLDPRELYAIIQDRDTLVLNRGGFYGGADVKHEHIAAKVNGKIKEVNRSDKGRILSLIVNNDCYIEMDARFEKQIGHLLKRGAVIEVSGDERIKKRGEIYSKDYRIITPQQISINGKVYLLTQLP